MKKKFVTIGVKVVVSIVILASIVHFFDIQIFKTINSVKSAEYLFFAAIIPLIVNPIISNNRWKLFLNIQGVNLGFFTLLRTSFIATFLGILFPSTSGSDAIRVILIEKMDRNYRGLGTTSVVMERLLGFMMLTLMGVIGAFICIFFGVSPFLLLLMLGIHLFLLALFFCLKNNRINRRILKFTDKLGSNSRLMRFFNDFYKAFLYFKLSKILVSSILLITLFQLSTILFASLIFRAFDVSLPFYFHLALMPVVQVMSILPFSISGFGIREGGFVFFYGLVGVDPAISLLVSILYYVILVLMPALVGMIFYLGTGERVKTSMKWETS